MKVVLIVLAALAGGVFLLAKNGHAFSDASAASQTAGGQPHVHCSAGCNTDVVQ